MSETPLPPNWEMRVDPKTGWPFYLNHDTKTTQWEHPTLGRSTASRPKATSSAESQPKHSNSTQESSSNQNIDRERSPIVNSHQAGNGKKQDMDRARNRPAADSSASPLPKSPKHSALDSIINIRKEAEDFHAKIEAFSSVKDSREYKYLEEMMERRLCKLDNIEANGDQNIRTQRKETVHYIQQCLDQLELKAFANETQIG